MTQPLPLESSIPLPPPARLGEVLGKYRLDRILATGGMGVVVAATHLQLNQPIAIKFMSPLLVENELGVSRFLLEARSAARIRSEHVVRVFDVDTLPSGTPYIVMEYLEGEDLGQMLARRGRVPIPEAIDYVLQACEAIAEAHVAGIVHRDLKPGNLFCCRRPDGTPMIKVVDFGVSKLLPSADAELRTYASTGPHVVMGTPLYSSPEQLRSSADVDARTDIWALGVILFELIAGEPPFAADSFMQICAKVACVPCPSLRDRRPGATPGLTAVVARCLEKDPDARFQTVAELARALAPLASRGSQLSVERTEGVFRGDAKAHPNDPTLPSAPESPKPTISPSSVTARPGLRPRSHSPRVLVWSVAGGALGGALVAVWAALALHRVVPPAPSRPPPSETVSFAPTTAPPSSDLAAVPSVPPREAPSAVQAPLAPTSRPPPAVPSTAVPPVPRPPPTPRPPRTTEGFGGLL